MPNLSKPPSVTDDGDWKPAYTGKRWVGDWNLRDGTTADDVEVELDEGSVVAAWCCGESALAELLEDLQERYEE
jgi:hypothetical protein